MKQYRVYWVGPDKKGVHRDGETLAVFEESLYKHAEYEAEKFVRKFEAEHAGEFDELCGGASINEEDDEIEKAARQKIEVALQILNDIFPDDIHGPEDVEYYADCGYLTVITCRNGHDVVRYLDGDGTEQARYFDTGEKLTPAEIEKELK